MTKIFLAVGVAVLLVRPAWAEDYVEQTLFSFDDDTQGWTAEGGAVISPTTEYATLGTGSLKVQLPKPQASFEIARQLDLSGWDKLKLDIHNTGDPFNFTLRAADADGHSYTSWYQRAAPGASTIEYSLRGFASKVPDRGRVNSLAISRIARINIRVDSDIPKAVTIYVNNVRVCNGAEPFIRPRPRTSENPVVQLPGNILENSDFELGLHGWGSWGEWDGGLYSFGSGAGENAHTGVSSAAIVCEKPGRGGISSQINLPAAGRYKLTFAVKGAGGADRMRYAIAGSRSDFSETVRVTDRWQVIEKTWEASPGNCRLYFFHVSAGTLYIDSASLVPSERKIAESSEEDRPAQPSKVAVKGDRTFVNGQPFFPIGIYGVTDPQSELADTGFNTPIGGATSASAEAWFDKCRDGGMMAIVNLTGVLRGHLPDQVVTIAEQVKQRASLLGYYLCDEPDHSNWNVTPAEIRQSHYLLAEADPDHPTIVLVMAWDRSMCYQYADTANIIASDPYSVDDMDKPVRTVLWMDDGRQQKQPVWAVLQIGWDRTPPLTPEAMVCQAYSSVASGADGIFWFELQWCKRHLNEWKVVQQLSLELREIHDDLCGEEPADMQPQFSNDRVIGLLKKTQQGMVLVTVNKTLENLGNVTINVPGLGDKKAQELFGGMEVKFDGGRLAAGFGPGERHVYRFAP